jgi:hypothetical protein
MNRTSKRIIDYPFQPLRRNSRRLPQRTPLRSNLPFKAGVSHVGRGGILIDS